MLGKVGISIPFAATVASSSVWAIFLLAVRKSPLERRSAQYRKRYAAKGGECRHKAASARLTSAVAALSSATLAKVRSGKKSPVCQGQAALWAVAMQTLTACRLFAKG